MNIILAQLGQYVPASILPPPILALPGLEEPVAVVLDLHVPQKLVGVGTRNETVKTSGLTQLLFGLNQDPHVPSNR